MIRRFNYTDRQKIPRSNVQLTWIERADQPLEFAGTIDLNLDRPLNPEGLVFVEAYSGAVFMRFPFGTVEHQEQPVVTSLTEFPPGLRPHFRVKVVEPGADRRLLASADAITPLAPDEVKTGRRSILPVETVDLGPLVWNLRFESNEVRLQLNSAIREPRDIRLIAADPDFIALVYPAVIRQILDRLIFGPERDSVEADHDWLVFASQLSGRQPPSREGDGVGSSDEDAFANEVNEWIDEAVMGFCRHQHAVEAFVQFKKEMEDLPNA